MSQKTNAARPPIADTPEFSAASPENLDQIEGGFLGLIVFGAGVVAGYEATKHSGKLIDGIRDGAGKALIHHAAG